MDKFNKTNELDIQGLKGIAMVTVVWSHIVLLFHPFIASHYPQVLRSAFFDGNWAVCMFLLISGYLAADKARKLNNFDDFRNAILKRYKRIALPLSPIIIITYILYLCHLSYIHDLFISTSNKLISSYFFNISVKDFLENLLFSPLGRCGILGPCWMLIYVFLGSIVIYITNISLRNVLPKTRIFILLLLIIIFKYYFSFYYSMGIAGMVLKEINIKFQPCHRFKIIIFVSSIIIFLAAIAIHDHYTVDSILSPHTELNGLSVILLFVSLKINGFLKRIFSFRLLTWLGDISFSLFAVHWPILCSLGCFLFLNFNSINTSFTILLCSFFCFLTSLLVSHFYYHFCKKGHIITIVKKTGKNIIQFCSK